MQGVVERSPLHEVVRIDLMDVQAIPDICSGEGRLGPVIAFAFHLLAVAVFPLAPLDCWVLVNKLIENDD